MKHFFLIVLSFVVLNLVTHAKAAAPGSEGSSLKTEGSCSGSLLDGTAVGFNYFSDWDGVKDVSKGAVAFTAGKDDLLTGKRVFKDGKDIYSVPGYRIILADSTGNTSALFEYSDIDGAKQTVEVQCDVRDYTYAESH